MSDKLSLGAVGEALKNAVEPVMKEVGDTISYGIKGYMEDAKTFTAETKQFLEKLGRQADDALKEFDNVQKKVIDAVDITDDISKGVKTLEGLTDDSIKTLQSISNKLGSTPTTAAQRWFDNLKKNPKLIDLAKLLNTNVAAAAWNAAQRQFPVLRRASAAIGPLLNAPGLKRFASSLMQGLPILGAIVDGLVEEYRFNEIKNAIQDLKTQITLMENMSIMLRGLDKRGKRVNTGWNTTGVPLGQGQHLNLKRWNDLVNTVNTLTRTVNTLTKSPSGETLKPLTRAEIGSEVAAQLRQYFKTPANSAAPTTAQITQIVRAELASIKAEITQVPAKTASATLARLNTPTSAGGVAGARGATRDEVKAIVQAFALTPAQVAATVTPIVRASALTPAQVTAAVSPLFRNTGGNTGGGGATSGGTSTQAIINGVDNLLTSKLAGLNAAVPRLDAQVASLNNTINKFNPKIDLSGVAKPSDIDRLVNAMNNRPITVTTPPPQIDTAAIARDVAARIPQQTVNVNVDTNAIATNVSTAIRPTLANIERTVNANNAGINATLNKFDGINLDVKSIKRTTTDTYGLLGGDALKQGMSLNPESWVKTFGSGLYQGGTPQVGNIPEMIGLFTVPLFFRAGFGQLDTTMPNSLSNPAAGNRQVKTLVDVMKGQFDLVDERLGQPVPFKVRGTDGQIVPTTIPTLHEGIEVLTASQIAQQQDNEMLQRTILELAEEIYSIKNTVLRDHDLIKVVVDTLGFKYSEVKRVHPTKLKLGSQTLLDLFTSGQLHYNGYKFDDKLDVQELLKRILMQTQITNVSHFERIDNVNTFKVMGEQTDFPKKPKKKSEWKQFVNTLTEPPDATKNPNGVTPKIEEYKSNAWVDAGAGESGNLISEPTTPNP